MLRRHSHRLNWLPAPNREVKRNETSQNARLGPRHELSELLLVPDLEALSKIRHRKSTFAARRALHSSVGGPKTCVESAETDQVRDSAWRGAAAELIQRELLV